MYYVCTNDQYVLCTTSFMFICDHCTKVPAVGDCRFPYPTDSRRWPRTPTNGFPHSVHQGPRRSAVCSSLAFACPWPTTMKRWNALPYRWNALYHRLNHCTNRHCYCSGTVTLRARRTRVDDHRCRQTVFNTRYSRAPEGPLTVPASPSHVRDLPQYTGVTR